jgi:ComF family protein
MLFWIVKIKNIFLNLIFPPLCLNCQKFLPPNKKSDGSDAKQQYLCANCLKLIKINNTLFCPICQARLANNKKICSHYYKTSYINSSASPKSFYYLLGAASNYDNEIIQKLIHYLKYKSFSQIASLLGQILIDYYKNCNLPRKNFIIIPIPLYWHRERRRGFNQSKLLAQIISRTFNLPLEEPLIRIKNTNPQAYINNYHERRKNVTNCFIIKNKNAVRNKNIILVDDVFTSGATAEEAVKILKENGARKIIVLVAAKA